MASKCASNLSIRVSSAQPLGQPDGDAWESLAIQQMWNEETHVAWEWPRHKRVVGSRTLEEKVFLAGPFATRSSWPYY